MLEKIKLALRISHSYLDDDIADSIKSARAEMIRSGISESKANDEEDSLIISAIKTYCLFVYSSDNSRIEGFRQSWEYQLENLRKSSGYMREDDLNV